LNQYREILGKPEMNNKDSAFLFNMGVHYPISLSFTSFKKVLDEVIQLLHALDDVSNDGKTDSSTSHVVKHTKRHNVTEANIKLEESSIREEEEVQTARRYKGYVIWKSTTAIEKEKVDRFPGGLNLTALRFYTNQVIKLVN
jgi:hypothetical protein